MYLYNRKAASINKVGRQLFLDIAKHHCHFIAKTILLKNQQYCDRKIMS